LITPVCTLNSYGTIFAHVLWFIFEVGCAWVDCSGWSGVCYYICY